MVSLIKRTALLHRRPEENADLVLHNPSPHWASRVYLGCNDGPKCSPGKNFILQTKGYKICWLNTTHVRINDWLFFHRNHTVSQGQVFYTVNITFLEVKMEDYGHPFTCHAGVSAAYVILKLPGNTLVGCTLLRALQVMARKHEWKRSDFKCLVWGSRVVLNRETQYEI